MPQSSSERTPDKTLQPINIFISSPSDVEEERQIAIHVIESFNRKPSIANHYFLNPLAYEDRIPPLVGPSPQTTVDRYMMKAGQSDIFICILWQRMGTPVIHEVTGEHFLSGTEYEFKDAYQAYRETGKPYILLYRCMKPIFPDADLKQLQHVQDFFKRFKGELAEPKGLVKKYRSNDEFKDTLSRDLDTIISNFVQSEDLTGSSLPLEVAHQDSSRVDLGEAPHSDPFYGREKELAILKLWIVNNFCKIVAICGIGGIGKTSLAAVEVKRIKDEFDYVLWWPTL